MDVFANLGLQPITERVLPERRENRDLWLEMTWRMAIFCVAIQSDIP